MTVSPSLSAAPIGPFDDPLEAWPNDDLLYEDAARDHLRRQDAALLEMLDWPQLRGLFGVHNALAGRHRARSRRIGVSAILLATAGVCFAAVSQLVAGYEFLRFPAEQIVAAVAASLTFVGGVIGLLHWGNPRSKNAWLGHRFWTERLRQLYFQHLLCNLPAAVKALQGGTDLGAWQADRAARLTAFEHDMRRTSFLIQAMREDLVEAEHWLDPAWRSLAPPAQQDLTPQVLGILTYLRARRIGIQQAYTQLKLQQTLASPRMRTSVLRAAGDALSVAVVLLAFATAACLLFGLPVDGVWVKSLLAAGAVAGATVASSRALDEGLRARVDAERYEWYLACAREAGHRFDTGGGAEQFAALREMEHNAYQELRRFTDTHLTARFMP